jgi:Ca-activated chloride channel family protein
MKNIVILYFFFVLGLNLFSKDDAKEFIKSGNSKYNSNKFNEAEIDYRKSLEAQKGSNTANFNLGDALYKQGKYPEAAEKFQDILSKNVPKEIKSQAYHNLGNSLLKSEKYQESIDAFKNSLKLNSSDKETKYNLEYAKRKLAVQQEQQKQDKKNDKNKKDDKDKKDGDKKDDKNGDKKDDKGKDDQKKDGKNGDNQDKKDGKDKDGKGEQPDNKDGKQGEQGQKQQKISKDDANRILQALSNEEKKVQKKLRLLKRDRVKVEKNW